MALSFRLSPVRSVAAFPGRARRSKIGRHRRFSGIDAARGAAMVFVCLSHFCTAYLYPLGHATTTYVLTVMSMVASPSFIAISGMVAGFLAAMCPETFPRLRLHLIDRGMFLLIVGHVVLAAAMLPNLRTAWNVYAAGYITDAIGVMIIVGPLLVETVPQWRRVALAGLLYAVSWIGVLWWEPGGIVPLLVKHYLVGVPDSAPPGHTAPAFPLVPWFAVYIVGTALGERTGAAFRAGDGARARALVMRVGLASLSAGLALFLTARSLRIVGVAWAGLAWILRISSPTQKFPPAPAYILIFGGAGLLAAWWVLELEHRRRLMLLVAFLRNLGQASLFAYFVQAFVYSTLRRLALPYTAAWPLLYAATLLFVGALAWGWCQLDGNRFFTVGMTALADAEHPQTAGAPVARSAGG